MLFDVWPFVPVYFIDQIVIIIRNNLLSFFSSLMFLFVCFFWNCWFQYLLLMESIGWLEIWLRCSTLFFLYIYIYFVNIAVVVCRYFLSFILSFSWTIQTKKKTTTTTKIVYVHIYTYLVLWLLLLCRAVTCSRF